MIAMAARIRRLLLTLLLLGPLLFASGAALAHPPDPTEGGRGGRIVRVTTLARDGPGSLAEALAAKGKRIVVFESKVCVPVSTQLSMKPRLHGSRSHTSYHVWPSASSSITL